MRSLGTSRRRSAAASAVVVAALLTTAACGGGDSDNGDGDGGGKGTGFNAAVDKVANPSDKKGGTLKFIGVQDADSWDTTRGYYGFAWNFMRYYSRQLVTPAAVPGEGGLELKPDLAKSTAKVSEDGKTYTYELKDGITWQDGKPITAQDIKYGIERQWAQDVLSGGPVHVKNTLDPEGKYKGPYKDPGGLDAIQTPDDKTIVFKLPKANSDFEQMLSMTSSSPVPKAKDTKSKYGLSPFSSGPYKFKEYSPNKKLVLVRNENWKRSTDTVRKALPGKITVTLISNPDELDKRLISGDYDVDLNATGLSPAGRASALKEHKGNVDNPETGFIRYAAFPQSVKPFDDIHCRKAAIYGSDHKSIQTARGGPMGGGDIGTNMLPPVVPGSDTSYDPYGLAKNDGAANVEKAKEELKKCGKPNGFKTTIAVRNNKDVEVDTAEAMQASLKKVGIEAQIDEYDGAQIAGIVGNPKVVKKKNYGIIVMGWGPDFNSVQGYGKPLWHSVNILPNGNNNFSEIDEPKIDKAFEKFEAELDEDKAAEIASSINKQVMEGAYYLPFTFEKMLTWRSSRLTNAYSTYAYSGQYDYASLGVK
ncbi:ABC transporter substrate-binding protein [Streptomyces sp. N2-109]|uniref:ABC transporter substrate-binding protein n=1 Tax=Streptomyces gossypii TaxID=2883101 RepID=A0ABT2JXY0_9ACTN|nr:ABC transporter substrate-binding protein [Streptomyces gossypii]MCT2592571.1 ABC transporter substrate-binding protein [Streptomyces gossypii]